MIAIAHFVAVTFYLGATAAAALPFARPVKAPVRVAAALLAIGLGAHLAALGALIDVTAAQPLSGLGPALSVAGFTLAAALLLVEILAWDASLTLAAAPLAAAATVAANIIGLHPALSEQGTRSTWLTLHIVLSFAGMAAYGTAAAAGTMYLLARHELKARRFGAIFRSFPPLDTLDRVNHLSSLTGFLALTLGISLSAGYSLTYGAGLMPKVVWGLGVWLGISAIALGRLMAGWQARRAAVMSTITFAAVVVLFVVFRASTAPEGRFL